MNRDTQEIKTLGFGQVIVAGSFKPNGGSAVDNTANEGKGFTVAWTSTGKFTITLADSYAALVSANFTIAMVAIADLKAQLGAVDVVTARTIVLNILAVATATDIAANAANRVYFELVLRNSSLT